MLIIPAIDIKNGKCIRLMKGELSKQISYSSKPLDYALALEKKGAEWIHVVDIDGAIKGELSNWETIGEILRMVKIKVQVGGGIQSTKNVERLIDMGAKRVVVSTVPFLNSNLFMEWVREFGNKIIVSLDVVGDRVRVKGWKEDAFELDRALSFLQSMGIHEIIYTDIERDGTLTGINVERIEKIVSMGFLLYVAGGVRDEKDINLLREMKGINGVIVGRALLEGRIEMGR